MAIPTLLCDFYKVSHREQYPEGTEIIYSTWTPRSNSYHPSASYVVAFGFQAFVKKYLIEYFDENFFSKPLYKVIDDYERVLKFSLGIENPSSEHIKALWQLGYLPLKIEALPEGTKVPFRVPMLTIENTNPKFFWLTNYFETLMSTELWLPSTTATIAHEYRTILDKFCEETGGDKEVVQFQGHDFSMRGMSSLEASEKGGAGHLLSFTGTDTIPAIQFLEDYYNANIENELVGCSIPATEHSVMCAGGFDNEFETYKRLITKVYPTGMISIVSDTWDLWKCITDIIKPLKDEIMTRDGRVVIRPDSGNPVDIICGLNANPTSSAVFKENHTLEDRGLIEVLWEIFGGTINEKGYKVLDPHIGAIYGDAITLERATMICQRLKNKGFASTNIVFGIGSYTYQYNTRDTFGFALKSTYARINGEDRLLFKDPVTDNGTKKSQKGKVAVLRNAKGTLCYVDNLVKVNNTLMKTIFVDGKLLRDEDLSTIRQRLNSNY